MKLKKEELLHNLPSVCVNRGFSQVPDVITMCYDLTTDEKALYLLLLKNYNDQYGYAYPSWEYIRLVLHRGDGKVSSTLKSLMKKGLIKVVKSIGRRNRYQLTKLDEVPCIALSEATYYFKKKADEQGIEVWGIVRKIIKSEDYAELKSAFTKETVKDYLRLLQQRVSEAKDEVVEIEELKEPKERKLPF